MAENAPLPEPGSLKVTDEIFMVECLKNLQTPAVVDVAAVAVALGYSNADSVGNRVSRLKKKFNLRLTTTVGSIVNDGNNSGLPNASPLTPRKRIRTPKATKTTANGEGAHGDTTPKVRKTATPRKKKNVTAVAPPEGGIGHTTTYAKDSKTEVKTEDTLIKAENDDPYV
ncbi:hypothetical protein LOZ53_001045 [Ophidiomyces ophidiicola]|uniref:uncharacterized protein n=1 Tax=Ophidiomyces ophidiicola TaxID=1387563 RepID=UPI0020C45D95|nr:uncharacterized protein LOZ57_000957 [Ophidiomyces ophidiicola]KAI1952874.1 hypothetical protein LOZ57_000957 [Ophidiomyces ophidiicola]KAI1976620.1 hypothetical protein LOZ55_004170 [Ophidiomyces ophidiicola]KAI1994818.1 hypothetical protein LOZ54_000871 [Ophidiomyces ophidiicola]KAI1996444.1 hypothetical protein LOZ53_001045 [Ophidiomyces ophidiicola]KAI2001050.1 hypothetical protein LOZ51_001341 [Ophidiomyces ophidiicola]